jgi:hypothetical protein
MAAWRVRLSDPPLPPGAPPEPDRDPDAPSPIEEPTPPIPIPPDPGPPPMHAAFSAASAGPAARATIP